MTENNITETIPVPLHVDPPASFERFVLLLKVMIGVLLLSSVAFHSMHGKKDIEVAKHENEAEVPNATIQEADEDKVEQKEVITRFIPPHCPISYLSIILQELCDEFIFKATTCIPEDRENMDKHKVSMKLSPKNSTANPRDNIVGFLTAVLLMVSLVAAFIELYKAKKQAPLKSKAPLTRKCSLADLTVLKHYRKEKTRRDSVMDSPEDVKQAAYFRRPPPLQRSSSTPAESIVENLPYALFNRSLDSRKGSVVVDNQQFSSYATSEHISGRANLDGRRYSILDSRKASIVDGKLVDRYDSSGRRISVDITSSSERKHHSRLVHRF
ncbi:hypothetical protein WA026_001700 [Henosepilachna vigintioctopunctata]|uniref:Uncharacterized protein n=1 Tax=Henosepilachna vigintioctopunctata TaxID=420089 RepID=A0AAW1URR1_9CUCU